MWKAARWPGSSRISHTRTWSFSNRRAVPTSWFPGARASSSSNSEMSYFPCSSTDDDPISDLGGHRLAEVDAPDALVLPHLVDPALGDQRTVLHDQKVVGDAPDEVEVVLDEQEAPAL